MSVIVSRLANGLAVVTDTMENVESVSLGVWVGVGARFESHALNGISHLLEHMAFKGTARRTARDIVEEVESVGGQINAYTSRESTAYYLRVLADDVPMAVDILADILQNSTFEDAELERERAVVIQEIGQCADTPDDLIFDHFQATAYPEQPLGRPILGSADHVRALTRERLAAYMGENYAAPSMVLAAAGKVGHEAVLRLAEAAFGGLKEQVGAGAPEAAYGGGTLVTERALEQVHLVLGYPGLAYGDEDYYAQSVLSSALGGGMSSRLFQEIREKRGLVYSIYAFTASYLDGGVFGIYAGTGRDNVDELMPVLSDELAGIGDTITDTELARVRAQLKAGLLMAMESTRARAERLGQHMLIYGRPLPPEEIVAKIDAVDRAAISRTSRRLFSGPATLAALGPVGGVRSLEGFAVPGAVPGAAE